MRGGDQRSSTLYYGGFRSAYRPRTCRACARRRTVAGRFRNGICIEVDPPDPRMAGLDGLLKSSDGVSNVGRRVVRVEADLDGQQDLFRP
jgi:hypothetical protein